MADEAKITIRLEPKLKKEFRLTVLKEGESMQGLVEQWITKYVQIKKENGANGD